MDPVYIPSEKDQHWISKYLYVDPIEGKVWKYFASSQSTREMGFVNKGGYHIITVRNHPVSRAQIVWYTFHGKWPQQKVRHHNGIRNDDRIENLYL